MRFDKKPKRVLVCGGRDFSDKEFLFDTLFASQDQYGPFCLLMHGGARGADYYAGQFALAHKIPLWVFAADWQRDGKAAGPIRNRRMLVEGKPELVIAFPGGRGTANMIEQAKAAAVFVIEVPKRG